MKMRKWFILCLLVVTIISFGEYLQGFEAEVAIYRNPALSPDESQVAFECRDWNTGMESEYDSLKESDIFLVDIKGSDLRQLTLYADNFTLSSDKSKVLLQTYYGLYLLDLDKRSTPRQVFNRFPEDILDGRYGSVEQISWSPSGKKFFFSMAIGISWERKYSIVDVETLEEKLLECELGKFLQRIQWIDDTTFFYEKDNEILTYNYLTKKGELLASGYPDESCTDPVLSPDMQKMLYRYTDQYKVRFGSPTQYDHRQRPQKIVVCEVKDLPSWAANELTKRLWSGEDKVFKKTDYLLLSGSISETKVSWFCDSRRLLIKGPKELWIYDLYDSSYTPVFLDSIPITEILLTLDQSKAFFITHLFGDLNGDGRFTKDEDYSDLKVYDFKNKECRTIFYHSGSIGQLRLSSDGSFLALAKEGNIWILDTETEKPYQLTFDGGANPQWLVKDRSIFFSSNGSLVKVDLQSKKYTYLTLGRGVEPNWVNNKEVVIKSRGKFWKISLDNFEVKEIKTYPSKPPPTKGTKYEVYVEEVTPEPSCGKLTEVRVKDIKTKEIWTIKKPWCNGIWDENKQ